MNTKLIIVLSILALLVFCNAKLYRNSEEVAKRQAERFTSEVEVNGHTYIYTCGGAGVAICPSAETLRWANSKE